MKSLFVLSVLFLMCCNQPQQNDQGASKYDPSKIQEGPILKADDPTKLFLVDITNASWYSAKLANAATLKSHDQYIIQSAQIIRKSYTRIKDKTKITSIPYQVEVPYFLTQAQNDSVNILQRTDSLLFDYKFVTMIRNNDAVILKKCDDFQASAKRTEDLQQLIDFCRSTVAESPLSKP